MNRFQQAKLYVDRKRAFEWMREHSIDVLADVRTTQNPELSPRITMEEFANLHRRTSRSVLTRV